MPSTTPEIKRIIDLVGTWEDKKRPLAEEFSRDGYRKFVETMNYHTRQLIREFDQETPEFWTSLQELAQNASTLTTKGAKIMVNHQDKTNL